MRTTLLSGLLVGEVELEVAAQLGDVAGGLDVVLREEDLAVLVDDDRGADDALDQLAVELLLAEGGVLLHHDLVRVGEQRDRQAAALAELRELLRLVRRDAEHLVAL